jgi:hypothetical protein
MGIPKEIGVLAKKLNRAGFIALSLLAECSIDT